MSNITLNYTTSERYKKGATVWSKANCLLFSEHRFIYIYIFFIYHAAYFVLFIRYFIHGQSFSIILSHPKAYLLLLLLL